MTGHPGQPDYHLTQQQQTGEKALAIAKEMMDGYMDLTQLFVVDLVIVSLQFCDLDACIVSLPRSGGVKAS